MKCKECGDEITGQGYFYPDGPMCLKCFGEPANIAATRIVRADKFLSDCWVSPICTEDVHYAPEPEKARPGWRSRTDTPVLMWDGPLDFSEIPDDPRQARRLLSEKLQDVGDQLWKKMAAIKGWST